MLFENKVSFIIIRLRNFIIIRSIILEVKYKKNFYDYCWSWIIERFLIVFWRIKVKGKSLLMGILGKFVG